MTEFITPLENAHGCYAVAIETLRQRLLKAREQEPGLTAEEFLRREREKTQVKE